MVSKAAGKTPPAGKAGKAAAPDMPKAKAKHHPMVPPSRQPPPAAPPPRKAAGKAPAEAKAARPLQGKQRAQAVASMALNAAASLDGQVNADAVLSDVDAMNDLGQQLALMQTGLVGMRAASAAAAEAAPKSSRKRKAPQTLAVEETGSDEDNNDEGAPCDSCEQMPSEDCRSVSTCHMCCGNVCEQGSISFLGGGCFGMILPLG